MRIEAAPAAYLSPVEQAFTNEAWLRDLRIGTIAARDLLDAQLRIGFRRSAGGERIELVPHSPAALALLRGPNAARAESVLQALDGAVRVGHERSRSKGISISETYEGFLLNTLIDFLQLGGIGPMDRSFAVALRDPTERPRFQGLVDAWVEGNEANATFGTWVNVWRRTGATLRALFEGMPPSQVDPKLATIASQALGHELQHSITPATGPEYEDADGRRSRLAWLEEGGSELTNLTLGSDRAVAKALGLPFDESLREVQYAEWSEGVYRLAALAGFDTATADGARRAAETLQHGTLTRAPGRYARAIAEHHGLTLAQAEQLRILIRDSAGEPDRIAAIERWVRERRA